MLGKIFFFLSFLIFAAFAVELVPPKIIYSAIIRNRLNSPIECHVVWLTPLQENLQGSKFTIMNGEHHHISEKVVDMGSWEGAAVIDKIVCGDMELSAPFEGVSSPQRDWRFTIGTQGIASVGTSS